MFLKNFGNYFDIILEHSLINLPFEGIAKGVEKKTWTENHSDETVSTATNTLSKRMTFLKLLLLGTEDTI